MASFKTRHPYQKRCELAKMVMYKNPGMIPVVLERDTRYSAAPPLDKQKFIVPNDLTLAQLMFVVRQRLKMSEEKALFIFFSKNSLEPALRTIGALYEDHKDSDGFLYATYALENTFGTHYVKSL
jgi:GABA(A) receptor-associated protein